VWQVAALGVLQVIEKAAGSRKAYVEVVAAETSQILSLELSIQSPSCGGSVKLPGRLVSHATSTLDTRVKATFCD
jgi:hypothetical protein